MLEDETNDGTHNELVDDRAQYEECIDTKNTIPQLIHSTLLCLYCCRCISRFASHLNQAHSVSAIFSPCGRFIATGSEDKAAYIYDIRSSAPLHKLKGHSDVVGTLAYHPLTPTVSHMTVM